MKPIQKREEWTNTGGLRMGGKERMKNA